MASIEVKKEIEKITQNAKKLFLEETERLFLERVKDENRLAKQYMGREIYELLQNIDDAFDADSEKECIASLVLKEGWLTVSNNGKPFTVETFQRLCQGNVSSKHGEYIGCKGIGFRSVLNWSDEIEIYSGEGEQYISARFSKAHADEVFNEIKDNSRIKSQVEELKRMHIKPGFPVFKAPEFVAPIEKNYDTVIRIKIKDNQILSKIEKDIRNFDKSILLFLPHIKRIAFTIAENDHWSIDKYSFGNQVVIKCGEIQSKFYLKNSVHRLKSEYEGADIAKMAVAIPVDVDYDDSKLYSFFPLLDVNSPFKGLLHATFCLTDNRNDLDLSNEEVRKVNKQIFELLLKLYVETVVEAKEGIDRLRYLCPIGYPEYSWGEFSFKGNLSKLNAESAYYEICRDSQIFYSVNEDYFNGGNENLVILKSVPDCFRGAEFQYVVRLTGEERLSTFAKAVNNMNPVKSESRLRDAIDSVSFSWNAMQRIEVFKWWQMSGFTILPKLLKSQSGKFIESSSEPCFLTGSITDLPSWANITVICDEDEQKLLEVYSKEINESQGKAKGDSNKRILPRLISDRLINLQEQSSRKVMISPVNNSVGNDYDRALEYTRWLWNIWQEDTFDSSVREVDFVLPSADRSVAKADRLYLGDGYGNYLGASLLRNMQGFKELETISLNGTGYDIEAFFRSMGVAKFPKLGLKNYSNIIDDSRDSLIWKYITVLQRNHPIDGAVSYFEGKLLSVEGAEKILRVASTSEIVKWLFEDTQLLRYLMTSEFEPDDSCLKYKPKIRGQKYSVHYNLGWKLPSFIRFIFSEVRWIEVDGEKHSPCELIISNDEFLRKIGVNCITERQIDKIADSLQIDRESVKNLFIAVGVKESYVDLNSKDFYGLLLNISELKYGPLVEMSKKTSRDIYRNLIENGRSSSKKMRFCEASEEKQKFFRTGKVLARNNSGESTYRPVNEVYFSSSAVLNVNDSYFIDVPSRSGQKEDFVQILNVKPYRQEYTFVDWTKSYCDEDFADDFKELIPCLMAYRKGKKDGICNLNIHLAKSARIKIGQDILEIKEKYSLLRLSKSNWIIFVGDEPNFENLIKVRIAECIVQVLNVFLNYPSKDFINMVLPLYRYSQAEREYIVNSEFGSSEELNETKIEIGKSKEFRKSVVETLLKNGCPSDLAITLNDIDWLDLKSVSEQGKIVEFLKKVDMSLSQLNDILDLQISVSDYNRSCLTREYEVRKAEFNSMVYHALLENKEVRSRLREIWGSFNFDAMGLAVVVDASINEADFDAAELTEKLFCASIEHWNIATCNSSGRLNNEDYSKTYERNKSFLLEEFDCAVDYINDFTNSLDNDSILYFDEQELIKNKFSRFMKERESSEAASNGLKNYDFQNLLDNVVLEGDVKPADVPDFVNSGNSEPGTVSKNRVLQKTARQTKQGDVAEHLVVKMLVDRRIKEVVECLGENYSVKWKSGATKRIRLDSSLVGSVDITESKDNLGYDIEVVSSDGAKKMFIEVKSTSSDQCAFIMSANEFTGAKRLDKQENCSYRVVFVSNLNINDVSSKPKVNLIDKCVYDEVAFKAIPIDYRLFYQWREEESE